MAKILVIGLDGASWNLLDPLIEKGVLPNLKKIKEKGISGNLKSILPTCTFPAWKVYSTGKNPGKLGVYWYSRIDWEKRKIQYHNSFSFKSKDLWDWLNQWGLSTGIIHMPGTFPPKEVNGFLISGPMANTEKDYTFPPELKKELSEEGYRINHRCSRFSNNLTKFLEDTKELIRLRFKIACKKMEEVDFLHLTIFCIDEIGHYFWGTDLQKECWKTIDEEIGKTISNFNGTVFIISDHGQIPAKPRSYFLINNWFKKRGYLKIKKDIGDLFYKIGLNRQNIYQFLNHLGLYKIIRKFTSHSLRTKAPLRDKWGLAMGGDKESKINWKKTKAIGEGNGPIYINPCFSHLKEEIKEELEKIDHVERVFKKEDIYHGAHLNEAPDLIVLMERGYDIQHGLGGDTLFRDPSEDEHKAYHQLQGILMAYGDLIRGNGKIENANLKDMAPTILHLMGCPIDKQIDGRVIKEIFAEDSKPYQEGPEYTSGQNEKTKEGMSKQEEEKIKQRLKNLGYLS